MDIHVRFAQGHSMRKIARDLGLSRNTVRRHLNKYEMPNYTKKQPRPSKLEPYKDYLIKRIDQAKPDWIPATVLFDEVTQRGYEGGIAQLRRFVCLLKPTVKPDPLVRFETKPGQQMQIDFTTIHRGKQTLKAFVATLGYSRACYVEFFDNERAEAWQKGLRQAFEYFGGVPNHVLCDNAKALIVKRDAYGEGEHQLHDEMLQMSKDFGFKLLACKPYRAKTKGKVERFNHYLKNSFIIPLKAELRAQKLELDVEIANAKIGPWLQRVAHQRIHGTTGEKPTVRLIEEVKHLQALPQYVSQSTTVNTTVDIQIAPPLESFNLQHSMNIYDALLGGEHVVA